MLFPDDTYYIGYILNDQPHFYGRMVFPNGDAYEGEFHKNRQHGEGVYYKNDGSYY